MVLLPLYGTDSDCAPSLSGSLSPPSLGRVQGGLRDFSTRIGLVSRCCSLRHALSSRSVMCTAPTAHIIWACLRARQFVAYVAGFTPAL